MVMELGVRVMSNKIIFIILFVFVSCGSHIVVNPEDCPQGGFWGDKNTRPVSIVDKEYDFEFSESYWTPLGFINPTDIYVKEIFDQHGINCKNVEAYRVEIKATWFDAFLRFIPLMSRKTVLIKGIYIPESFTEEE